MSKHYYYNQLSKEYKQVYTILKNGLKELAASITIPKLPMKELADIYFMIRMDDPEIFYTVKFVTRGYRDADHVELIPEYIFEKKKIKEHQQAMRSRVRKLVLAAEKLSEKDKELYIHDFICQNVRYDKLKKPYSHEIIGAFGQGVAVCEGIAKAVKVLCDNLGIWCIIALSDNNPEKKIKYRHAWNIIKLGGQYYHLDATFDNSLKKDEMIRYDYFNISDKQIFRDHEPAMWKIPACTDGDHFYYKEKKLSFTKTEEVRKRAGQAAKKGRDFIFHWRGGYLTKEVLSELLEILKEEASKFEKYAYISLNWPQAVIKTSFKTEAFEEKVLMEEANEGEAIDAE